MSDMDGRLPLILDGGDCQVGVESTVITLAGDTPVLLRPGYITKSRWSRCWAKRLFCPGRFWQN